jgi:hypothetical protein
VGAAHLLRNTEQQAHKQRRGQPAPGGCGQLVTKYKTSAQKPKNAKTLERHTKAASGKQPCRGRPGDEPKGMVRPLLDHAVSSF